MSKNPFLKKPNEYSDVIKDIIYAFGQKNDHYIVVFSDKREQERLLKSIDIKKVDLTENEIDSIISFLDSLTGKSKNNRPFGPPNNVPSGLKVDK